MDITNYKTLTGYTLAQVIEELDRELPKEAYKAVPGGANLTDISPGFMRESLATIFGFCGIGWGYEYSSEDLTVETVTRVKSGGGERVVQIASLKKLVFWFIFLDELGAERRYSVASSGGAESDSVGYAMSGAITNALSKATSNIGFQKSVYMGRRDHRTVGKNKAPVQPVVPAPSTANDYKKELKGLMATGAENATKIKALFPKYENGDPNTMSVDSLKLLVQEAKQLVK